MTSVRNSNVELLKIFAIILIIVNHVVQSLSESADWMIGHDYVYDISHATSSIQGVIVSMMRYFGTIGNAIFLVCTSWFLVDGKEVDWKKVFHMVIDVWVISVLILAVVSLAGGVSLTSKDVVKQFFPTLFGNNWYITCYLLFFMVHPILNSAIYSMDRTAHFCLATIGFVLYYVLEFLIGDCYLFSSTIIYWFVVYFVISFVKRYLPVISSGRAFYYSLLALGLIGTFGLVIVTNVIGLHLEPFANHLQRWNLANNPFVLMLALGLFLCANSSLNNNRVVNYLSSLSLFVYIIHENYLFRKFYRPQIWQYIHDTYGYDYILLWVCIIASAILIASLFLSALYKNVSRKIVSPIADRLCGGLDTLLAKINLLLLRLY